MYFLLYKIKKFLFNKIESVKVVIIDLYFRIFKFKKSPLIISFYSDFDGRTFYQDRGMRLINKLNSWGVNCDICELDDQGGYQKNCLYKPVFIYKKLLEHRQSVLWLDVDTEISDPRHLSVDTDCDFTAISLDGTWQKMQAGLLFFNYSKSAIYVLREWMLHCNYCSSHELPELDHEALKFAILKRYSPFIRVSYRKTLKQKVGFVSSNSIQSNYAQSRTSFFDDEREKVYLKIPTFIVDDINEEIYEEIRSKLLTSRIVYSFKSLPDLSKNQMHLLNEVKYYTGVLC